MYTIFILEQSKSTSSFVILVTNTMEQQIYFFQLSLVLSLVVIWRRWHRVVSSGTVSRAALQPMHATSEVLTKAVGTVLRSLIIAGLV